MGVGTSAKKDLEDYEGTASHRIEEGLYVGCFVNNEDNQIKSTPSFVFKETIFLLSWVTHWVQNKNGDSGFPKVCDAH